MEYWRGEMDWPLDTDWKCEICGTNSGLEWGLIHAQCRCNSCHSPYWMRDASKPDEPIVTRPISGIKDEYKEPIRQAVNALGKREDELTDADIDEFMPKVDVSG